MAKLIYIDSCVLIAAARGRDEVAIRALEVLDDPDASFASSIFVKLEVLPKPTYFKQQLEARFYKEFFSKVAAWAQPDLDLTDRALVEANRNGLNALDALHVTAAAAVNATELVTAEGTGKEIHRTQMITVRSIR